MKKKSFLNDKGGSEISGHLAKYYYIYLFLIILVIFLIFYVYSSNYFKSGEIVYSLDNPNNIGTIRAFNVVSWSYVVVWSNGNISEEKKEKIAKISNLNTNDLKNITYNESKSGYTSSSNLEKLESGYSDYFYESTGGIISGIFYRDLDINFKLAKRGCKPDFLCGSWSNCTLDYNFYNLINNSLQGIEYRYCEDKNSCSPNLVDSRNCILSENITINKKEICGKEIFEIMDSKGNRVAFLDTGNRTGFLDVNFNLLGDYEC